MRVRFTHAGRGLVPSRGAAVLPAGARHDARGQRALCVLDLHHLSRRRSALARRGPFAWARLRHDAAVRAVRTHRRQSRRASWRLAGGEHCGDAGGAGRVCALGAISAAFLAAVHDGGANPSVGTDACRHRQRRGLFAFPLRAIVRARVGRAARGVRGRLAALIGSALMLTQNDIKKSLGYSTMGQMGFMVMECGLGAFSLAVYHLIAHGLFKATLFLGSGGVISAARRNDGVPPDDISPSEIERKPKRLVRLPWMVALAE